LLFKSSLNPYSRWNQEENDDFPGNRIASQSIGLEGVAF